MLGRGGRDGLGPVRPRLIRNVHICGEMGHDGVRVGSSYAGGTGLTEVAEMGVVEVEVLDLVEVLALLGPTARWSTTGGSRTNEGHAPNRVRL